MTFSHNPPHYLCCATMALGKGVSLAFHRLINNNTTCWKKTLGKSTLAKLMPKSYGKKKAFYPNPTKPFG